MSAMSIVKNYKAYPVRHVPLLLPRPHPHLPRHPLPPRLLPHPPPPRHLPPWYRHCHSVISSSPIPIQIEVDVLLP